jgi:hypothetical protein
MNFSSFFIRRILLPFFMITACVSIAEGVLGYLFHPDYYLPYSAMFSPALYGAATTLPSLVYYSHKDLSVMQIRIRRAVQIALIEATVFTINYLDGNISSFSVAVALFFTVLIICLAVYAVNYLNDMRVADELNAALRQMKSR